MSFLNDKTEVRGFQSVSLLYCTVERAWKILEGVKWFNLSGFLEVILIRGCRIQILDPNQINPACFVLFFFVFLNWRSISIYWGTWIKPQHSLKNVVTFTDLMTCNHHFNLNSFPNFPNQFCKQTYGFSWDLKF